MKKPKIELGDNVLITVTDEISGSLIMKASSRSFQSFDEAKSVSISMLSELSFPSTRIRVVFWNTTKAIRAVEFIQY